MQINIFLQVQQSELLSNIDRRLFNERNNKPNVKKT